MVSTSRLCVASISTNTGSRRGGSCYHDRDTCPTAIGSRDLRNQSFYGNLGPGETVLYAAGPQGTSQGRIILKADGSISIYTTNDNTSGGTAVYFRISPQGLQFISPDCVMSCDKTGFHVKTSQGAKLNLTNIGSIPGLPVSPTSAFSVQAGTVTLDSSMISLGPSAANGGLGYMNAVYGLLPAVPLVPIIGEGIGVVAVNASTSTKVCIGI